jgi:hypothetical protein
MNLKMNEKKIREQSSKKENFRKWIKVGWVSPINIIALSI